MENNRKKKKKLTQKGANEVKSGVSRAEANKAVRQEALREQLSKGKHIQHVLEMADKLSNLDNELESTDIQRLKAASDIKLKLVDKYLASLKAVEITGEDGQPIEYKWTVEVINAKDTTPS